MRFWRVLLLTMSLLLFPVGLVDAEAPPSPSRTLAELQGLFPNLAQLPPGMVVQETGGRTAEDIAATFPDPVDALDALSLGSPTGNTPPIASWAQPGAPLSTPARIEVSLHQFSSSGGAAYMLPYFAQGRSHAWAADAARLAVGTMPRLGTVRRGSHTLRADWRPASPNYGSCAGRGDGLRRLCGQNECSIGRRFGAID